MERSALLVRYTQTLANSDHRRLRPVTSRLPRTNPAADAGCPPVSRQSRRYGASLFGHSGWGLGGWDIEASECVLSQEADRRDSVEGNGYPHTVQLPKLHCEVNGRDPKGGALGGHSLNSSDTESARIYPDLPAQEVFILPLREDPQNVLGKDAEVLLPKKNKVIVFPTDLLTVYFLRRVSFPVQKLANYSFCARVTFHLNNLVCLRVGRNEIDLGDDLRGGSRIIAAQHFVFSNHLIGSRLSGLLMLDVLQALQDQGQIGRFDFSGGRSYL
jgi:hypothetical protein